jgi:hypothetical protein
MYILVFAQIQFFLICHVTQLSTLLYYYMLIQLTLRIFHLNQKTSLFFLHEKLVFII